MGFPVSEFIDLNACYHKLVGLLHPDGLACSSCKTDNHTRVHHLRRVSVLANQCTGRGRVFNAFTGTAMAGTLRGPAEVMLILGNFDHHSTRPRAGLHRRHLLKLRWPMLDHAER